VSSGRIIGAVTARVAARLEAWGLILALGVLVAFGVAFGAAVFLRPPPPADEDGPGNPGHRYRAAQAVEAWHDGRWYPAHVHSVSDGRYFITYDGFSVSWNEWVGPQRLRSLSTRRPAASR
jgi:hypothetical protein